MTDFRLDVSYPDHVKTQKLVRRLGAEAFLSHVRLFAYVAENRPTGVLAGMDIEDIELAAGWAGAPGAFVQTLIDLTLIDVRADQTLIVHDWQKHNQWVTESPGRQAHARKKNHERWHVARGIGQPGCELCQSVTQKSEQDLASESVTDTATSDGESSFRSESVSKTEGIEEESEAGAPASPSLRLVPIVDESGSTKKARKAKPQIAPDAPEYIAAVRFEEAIRRNDPKFALTEPQRQKWASELRSTIETRGLGDTLAAITYAQADSRERAYTLSPKSLARNFPKIAIAMQGINSKTGGNSHERQQWAATLIP